jgi:murein DD-endopeptidase MepM/ murein hydrolase activator NlpD
MLKAWLLLLLAFTGCAQGPVPILNPYGANHTYGGTPYPRELSGGRGWHTGVDIGANMLGAPVLATADGVITVVRTPLGTCGNAVVIYHPKFDRRTQYCHLGRISDKARIGVSVQRGDVIGDIGQTGATGPIPHLHFAVLNLKGEPENPVKLIVGCFDPNKTYPEDRLALTWPIECREK